MEIPLQLRKISKISRSSPQRQEYLKRVRDHYNETASLSERIEIAILLLDVVTRWGSTGIMMRRAIDAAPVSRVWTSIDSSLCLT